MTAHRVLYDILLADHTEPDPGASGTIAIDRDLCFVPLVTATTETRTLAPPLKEGQLLALHLQSQAGTCTVSFATAFDQSSSTSLVFTAIGQFASSAWGKVKGPVPFSPAPAARTRRSEFRIS